MAVAVRYREKSFQWIMRAKMLVTMEHMLTNRYHHYSNSAEDEEFLKKMNELFDDYRKNLTNKNYNASDAIFVPQVWPPDEETKDPVPPPSQVQPRGGKPKPPKSSP